MRPIVSHHLILSHAWYDRYRITRRRRKARPNTVVGNSRTKHGKPRTRYHLDQLRECIRKILDALDVIPRAAEQNPAPTGGA